MFGEVKEEADDDDEDEEGVEAKIDSTLQANVSMRRSVGKYSLQVNVCIRLQLHHDM